MGYENRTANRALRTDSQPTLRSHVIARCASGDHRLEYEEIWLHDEWIAWCHLCVGHCNGERRRAISSRRNIGRVSCGVAGWHKIAGVVIRWDVPLMVGQLWYRTLEHR